MSDSEVLASGEGAPPSEDDNVFLRAIRVLQERGWHQGSLTDDQGESVCVMGALWAAEKWAVVEADRHLRVTLGFEAVGDYSQVPDWNDDPHTSFEDVVLALKDAASTWPGDRAAAEPPEAEGEGL